MNIVFDVGSVLLEWNPERFLRERFPNLPSEVAAQVFGTEEWLALDAGTMSRAEAEAVFATRTGLSAETVHALLEQMPEALRPVPEMVALLAQLQSQGRSLYVLSNMPEYVAVSVLARHAFFEQFDGLLFSYEVQMLKPQPAIFDAMLERFDISAGQSVFIDDSLPNLQTASEMGFTTLHMEAPDGASAQVVERSVQALLAGS